MVLITCHTPDREFWGTFEDSNTALRLLFEALAETYGEKPPSRLSISYCPVGHSLMEVGTLFEGAKK